MLNLIKYLDARFGESGTWASIAVGLTMLHINIDPGLWKQIVSWGIAISIALGVLLKEGATGLSFSQVASDTLSAASTSLRTTSMMLGLMIPLLIGLSACGSNGAAAGASEAAVGLTAIEQTELQYVDLPACPVTAGLCKDPEKVIKLKRLDNVAYAAVKAALASGNSTDLVAANAAIAAVQAAIPLLQ